MENPTFIQKKLFILISWKKQNQFWQICWNSSCKCIPHFINYIIQNIVKKAAARDFPIKLDNDKTSRLNNGILIRKQKHGSNQKGNGRGHQRADKIQMPDDA